MKKNTRHSAFIIGAISFVLFLLGLTVRGNNYVFGVKIIVAAIVLGAIHWIWAIIDVIAGYDLNFESKKPLVSIGNADTSLGELIYYMMKRKNISM